MDINDFIPNHPNQPQGPSTAYSIVGRQVRNKLASLGTMQIPVGYPYYIPVLTRPVVKQARPDSPGIISPVVSETTGPVGQMLNQLYNSIPGGSNASK